MFASPDLETARPVYLPDPINRNHPINSGRVAWWLALPGLDGGKTLYDLIGLHPASIVNNTIGWSSAGTPFLDGTAGYIDTGTKIQNLAPGNGSIAWSIFHTALFNDGLDHAHWSQFAVGSPEFGFRKFSNQDIFCGFAGGVGGDQRVIIPADANTYPSNVWCRYCFTWIAGGFSSLYLNGTLIGINGMATIESVPTPTITIGRYDNSPVSYFNCKVNDFAIWNRTLSAVDVTADSDLSQSNYPGVLNRY